MSRAAITGVGGFVPDEKLTNAMLEKMVNTNEQWIVERTGIKERRILSEKGKGSSDLGVEAVKDLCSDCGLKVEEIDLLICATTTPDRVFPATANIISDKLGVKNAFSFDVGAACSGFLYALSVGQKFVESGSHKKVVVVGVDKMSSILDYSDRATSIIFGDGAGAVLLEPSNSGNGIIDSCLYSDGEGVKHLHQKAGGSIQPPSKTSVDSRQHYVYQEGATVFKWAVTKMADAVEQVMLKNNLTADDLAWLVPHQANKRIIDATARRANLSMDKVMLNIEKYGNTTSGTLPLCLWDWKNKLKAGDNIILCSFGGGFTWGATYLKWGK